MTSHFWGHLLMTLKLQGYKLTWTRESNKQILSGQRIIAFCNPIFSMVIRGKKYFDMPKDTNMHIQYLSRLIFTNIQCLKQHNIPQN